MKELLVKHRTTGAVMARLSPATDGISNCSIDNALNSECVLTFSLPTDNVKWQYVNDANARFHVDGKVFVIVSDEGVTFTKNDDGNEIGTVMAHETWSLLDADYQETGVSGDPAITDPSDLAFILPGGGNNLSGNLYPTGSAAHALYVVLNGNIHGWTIGECTVQGIHDLETEKQSRLNNIRQIIELWGGIILWDSEEKKVYYYDENTYQPMAKLVIRYGKNQRNMERIQNHNFVTRLYPFGNDDLDIAAVNGDVKYLQNFTHTTELRIGMFKDPDIYDAQQLKDRAQRELDKISRVRYVYKMQFTDLRTLEGYEGEDFELGQIVKVHDPDFGTQPLRLIKHKYDVFQPWNCEIEMGDRYEKLEDSLKRAIETSSNINSIMNNSNQVTNTTGGSSSGTPIHVGDTPPDDPQRNSLWIDTTESSPVTSITYPPTFVGQMAITPTSIYIAKGTDTTDDWVLIH